MVRKRVYGMIWSDNDHAFGDPVPISEDEINLFSFPDAIIYARNKKEASEAVKKINEKYKETIREEIPSVFDAEKLT